MTNAKSGFDLDGTVLTCFLTDRRSRKSARRLRMEKLLGLDLCPYATFLRFGSEFSGETGARKRGRVEVEFDKYHNHCLSVWTSKVRE